MPVPLQMQRESEEFLGKYVLDKYCITQILAKGGFGTVFLAEHASLKSKVVIKRLHTEFSACPEFSERFMNEGKVAVEAKSEYVCAVFDAGYDANFGHYLVMEHLDGEPLSKVITDSDGKKQPKPFRVVRRIIHGVLRGVSHIHNHGIVHRDLKTENIFIIKSKKDETAHALSVKILDFGIAKVPPHLRDAKRGYTTAITMGTPDYMAPEQFMDMRSAKRPADIWSIGVIMYELLTGSYPYEEHRIHPYQAAAPGSTYTLRPISRISSQCDVVAIMEIIRRCLDRDPSARYDSATALWRDIDAVTFDDLPSAVPSQIHTSQAPAGVRPGPNSIKPTVFAPPHFPAMRRGVRPDEGTVWVNLELLEKPSTDPWADLGPGPDALSSEAVERLSAKHYGQTHTVRDSKRPAETLSPPTVGQGLPSSASPQLETGAEHAGQEVARMRWWFLLRASLFVGAAVLLVANLIWVLVVNYPRVGLSQAMWSAWAVVVGLASSRALAVCIVSLVVLWLFLDDGKVTRLLRATFAVLALVVLIVTLAYSLVAVDPATFAIVQRW